MTWSVKYPLSIIAGGDTKQGGFTKVKDEFTSLYGDLDTHIHDGNPDKGPKISAANITNTAAGNIAATDVQAAINELDTEKAALAGATFTGVVNEAKGANIASAATVNLTTATGNLIHITGTDAITAVTLGSGMRREVIFDGALTLTHHATNNNLPGGANITTAAGDRATYWSDGTTVYCVKYQRADGSAVIVTSASIKTILNASGDAPIYACRAWVNFNGTGVVAINGSGNVTSITDNGTGDYTVNFTTAMSDANYVANISCGKSTDNIQSNQIHTIASGSVRFVTLGQNAGQALVANDSTNNCVSIFR